MNNTCHHCDRPTGSKSNWCNDTECQEQKVLEIRAGQMIESKKPYQGIPTDNLKVSNPTT